MSEKQKEVEGICNPIISKVYQAGGGPSSGGAGGSSEEDDDIPNHDEL